MLINSIDWDLSIWILLTTLIIRYSLNLIYENVTVKKILAVLLLTLPTLTVAVDLEGYYFTAKGGVYKSMDTGVTGLVNSIGDEYNYVNEDLGSGTAFGVSAGKYITDNFRLELEAIKRTGYKFDTPTTTDPNSGNPANIQSVALFVNGFYDFQTFSLGSTPITTYVGGGVGISRNKMGISITNLSDTIIDGKTISEFAYKLSAGTLINLTKNISLDVNYQYVNLGEFESGTNVSNNGVPYNPRLKGVNGGEIKSQELMVGLQYTFN